VQGSEFVNAFHQTYFLTILQEIFAVLTDTFHKPGFKLHTAILQHLFCLVSRATVPCLVRHLAQVSLGRIRKSVPVV
jgi:hypothetical protein